MAKIRCNILVATLVCCLFTNWSLLHFYQFEFAAYLPIWVWCIFDQAKINRCRLLRKHRQREMFSTINSSRGFSFYYTGDQRTLWETFFPLLFPSMLINGLCRLEFFINRWISNFKVWNRRNRISPESVQDIMMIYESERLQPEDDNEDEEITSQPQEDDQ